MTACVSITENNTESILRKKTQHLLNAESLHHNHILMISFKSHHAGVQRQEYKKIIIVLWTQHCLFNHETQ